MCVFVGAAQVKREYVSCFVSWSGLTERLSYPHHRPIRILIARLDEEADKDSLENSLVLLPPPLALMQKRLVCVITLLGS